MFAAEICNFTCCTKIIIINIPIFLGTSSPVYVSFKDKWPHDSFLPTQIPFLRWIFSGTLTDILRRITGRAINKKALSDWKDPTVTPVRKRYQIFLLSLKCYMFHLMYS